MQSTTAQGPFRHRPTLAQLNAGGANTALQALGIEFIELGEDFIRAKMPVDQRTCQPYGLLHGGASALLAETLGSVAANLCVDRDDDGKLVGIEINANHLRAVTQGNVIGTARPVRIGRQIQVWDIRIEDEQQRLVCVSRLTLAARN